MITDLVVRDTNLYVDQGNTYSKTFTIKNNNVAVDLTGYTIEAYIKRYYNTSKSYTLTSAIVLASAGTITLSMTEIETNQLVNDRYVYIVKARGASNTVKIMGGQILVTQSAGVAVNTNNILGNQAAALDPVASLVVA